MLRYLLIAVVCFAIFAGVLHANDESNVNKKRKDLVYNQTHRLLQFPEMESPSATLYAFFDASSQKSYKFYLMCKERYFSLKKEKIQIAWIPVSNAKSILSDNFKNLDKYFGKKTEDRLSKKNYNIVNSVVDGDFKFPFFVWEQNSKLRGYIGSLAQDDFSPFLQIVKHGHRIITAKNS